MLTPLPNSKEMYRDSVTQAMAGFQLLEEFLKGYIDLYYETIRLMLKGKLQFGFVRDDVKDAPMGRLLVIFAKTCPDQELVRELREVVKHRDHAAHQAFLHLYDQSKPDDQFAKLTTENLELASKIGTLMERVNGQSIAVLKVMQAAAGGSE
jgi:hypothetical protein